MKAAQTNMIQRGITKMLGLSNMTWSEIKEGVDRASTSQIAYSKESFEGLAQSVEEKTFTNKEGAQVPYLTFGLVNETTGEVTDCVYYKSRPLFHSGDRIRCSNTTEVTKRGKTVIKVGTVEVLLK